MKHSHVVVLAGALGALFSTTASPASAEVLQLAATPRTPGVPSVLNLELGDQRVVAMAGVKSVTTLASGTQAIIQVNLLPGGELVVLQAVHPGVTTVDALLAGGRTVTYAVIVSARRLAPRAPRTSLPLPVAPVPLTMLEGEETTILARGFTSVVAGDSGAIQLTRMGEMVHLTALGLGKETVRFVKPTGETVTYIVFVVHGP